MIDFVGVGKRFGSQVVLDNATFRIQAGERAGIVGPNGAGKSTIFALVSGEMTPDRGGVNLPRGCRLGYLHQQLRPGSHDANLLEYAESGVPELVRLQREIDRLEHCLQTQRPEGRASALRRLGECQTRFESLGGYAIRHRAEAALSGLGFAERDFARPFASFSGGWQMRAELARVTVAEADLLLMDEPSNYLDTVAVEWLQKYLREFAGTLVLISHDRYLLNSLCDVTIEVAHGQTTRYSGNYDRYVQERQSRLDQQIAARNKQERIRRQAERFIERFRAKNTKASQVQSRIKMLERMDEVRVVRPAGSPGRIRIPHPPPCGRQVLQLQDVSFSYDGQMPVLEHVELAVQRGERTALVGLNGTGKTTLLRLLAGQLQPTQGARRAGHRVTVGYQSQEFTETLAEQATVFDSVKSAGGASDEAVRTLLGGFGFCGDAVDKAVGVLSGGEKVRLAFARLLIRPPSFLILDEPTTHLDIPARETLEDGLRNYTGTLYFVSHDVEFVRRVATSIVAMTPPGIRIYPGGYDDYRAKLLDESREAAQSAARKRTALPSRPAPARRAERRERAETVQKYSRARREIKRQVDRLERDITKMEAEQNALAERLSSGDAETDYAGIHRRLAELQQVLADTTRRWEAFAIELDELERAYAAERG